MRIYSTYFIFKSPAKIVEVKLIQLKKTRLDRILGKLQLLNSLVFWFMKP